MKLTYWSGRAMSPPICQSYVPAIQIESRQAQECHRWKIRLRWHLAQERNLSKLISPTILETDPASIFLLLDNKVVISSIIFHFLSCEHFGGVHVIHSMMYMCAWVGQLEYIHLSAPFVAVRNKEVNLTAILWPSQVGTVTYIWWIGNNIEVL